MPNPALSLLLTRRSVSANSLGEPGPSQAELELMLKAASRVPDHKKLVPWRFILFQGKNAVSEDPHFLMFGSDGRKDSQHQTLTRCSLWGAVPTRRAAPRKGVTSRLRMPLLANH